MKRARIVLSALALFAVVGGAVAFKAAKFNGQPAFTFTKEYTTNGIVYTRAANAFLPKTPAQFITNAAGAVSTVYSTTGTTTTAIITLTEDGGTATITFPAYGAQLLPNTFVTLTN